MSVNLAKEWQEDSIPDLKQPQQTDRKPKISFFTPSQCRNYEPQTELCLVGNNHILRGEIFVIGGEAGVGKSRAIVALAIAGATQQDWFGLKVHRPFKTMVIQNENGRYRLKKDFEDIECDSLDDFLRISEPPPYGMNFGDIDFRQDIQTEVEKFKPDVVILDPWNAAATDDKQKDYAETFEAILASLPTGENRPAVGIVAHLRKPSSKARTGGVGMMHDLAGSHLLASRPRCVFIMVRATDEETDDNVIFTNPKNNNGEQVTRSAWQRRNGLFVPILDFDWNEFDKPQENRKTVTLEHLRELFNGCLCLERKRAVKKLCEIAEIQDKAAYKALDTKAGKFRNYLYEEEGMLSFRE